MQVYARLSALETEGEAGGGVRVSCQVVLLYSRVGVLFRSADENVFVRAPRAAMQPGSQVRLCAQRGGVA